MGYSSPLVRARSMPRGKNRSVVISASRKEAPLAVTRNRIRRRLRAALMRIGDEPRGAIMLIGTSEVAKVPFGELVTAVKTALRNL